MEIILSVIIAAAVFLYAGWVIYKSFRRIGENKSCNGCGNCGEKK